MSHWRLWFSPGKTGCYRCGSKDSNLASPWMFSGLLWCVKCLKETGVL